MIRQFRTGNFLRFGGLLLITFIIAGCSDDSAGDVELTDSDRPEEAGFNPESIERVDELTMFLDSAERDELRGHRFEIDAWISPAPKTSGLPGTPPQGCPIIPEKQDWLSDEPIQTQIQVAGTTIPNDRLADEIPVLRLVVPYALGFVDIPERARLRGYVLDDAHAECPSAESLFILEEVVEVLPADRQETGGTGIDDWQQLTHSDSGVVIEYPAGWEIEERDTGNSARFRFVGPDEFRSIRLEVHGGETFWHPDADGGNPPDVLGGDRREPAFAGQASARLVDDTRRTSSGERELRLVFNHQERTIFLAMVIRDGAALDAESVTVFSEIAHRMHLQGDVAMSDPMDPVLAASEEIGEGPFMSEADARYVAVNASGMSGAEAIDAKLVSERDARVAVDGACSNFDGRPSGVWLITVDGITPGGREVYRLVYLDAATGTRLCQAEAPGVS